MENELESSKADVARLMDILYGVDKAKEFAKIDQENHKERQIRGYHIGPSADVVRRMYNGGRVGVNLLLFRFSNKQNQIMYLKDMKRFGKLEKKI